MTAFRTAAAIAVAGALFGAVACGGSSSSGGNNTPAPVPNTVVITAGRGPSEANPYVNGAFVSVTICVPGTSQCTTVPDVLLDTGSSGLRVLSSALGGLPLPNMTSGGATIANCIQYVDLSYNWGAVARADVKLAGEVASTIPVQVIADPASTFPSAPSTCTNGGTAANTVDALSANGILGVSSYLYDCGPACAPGTTSNGGVYFACSGASCQVTTVALLSQLRNPVAAFSSDNNGVTITLPALPETGLPSTTGTLTFGIGTQTDNALGSAIVQTQNGSGNITTVFQNASYSSSFIDSGSNALYFLDSKTTGLPACQFSAGLYCPSTTQFLMATNTGANGKSNVVNFAVANADKLPAPNWVFDDVAGSSSVGGSQSGLPSLYFDWGLPFFFGRTVFVAIEGRSTPGGAGPYWAY
ncbi:MAG: DUF3443 family protein [Bacteroidales bacterium]